MTSAKGFPVHQTIPGNLDIVDINGDGLNGNFTANTVTASSLTGSSLAIKADGVTGFGPGPKTVRCTSDTAFDGSLQTLIPGLSVNIQAGFSYIFEAFVTYIGDTPTAGVFAYITMAGTATTSAFKAFIWHSADGGVRQQTTLGTNTGMNQSTAVAQTGVYGALLHGHVTCNGSGTLLVVGASSGTLGNPDSFTVQSGSDLRVWIEQ